MKPISLRNLRSLAIGLLIASSSYWKIHQKRKDKWRASYLMWPFINQWKCCRWWIHSYWRELALNQVSNREKIWRLFIWHKWPQKQHHFCRNESAICQHRKSSWESHGGCFEDRISYNKRQACQNSVVFRRKPKRVLKGLILLANTSSHCLNHFLCLCSY